MVENLGPEHDCKNRHVIDPVDNSTALDDHIAAADDSTGTHDPVIDLGGTSYGSELEVSETQVEMSDVGEMNNEIESDGVSEFRHNRSVAHRTQGCNTDHRDEREKRRVSVQARPFRRAAFVRLPMSFEKHVIYNCRS